MAPLFSWNRFISALGEFRQRSSELTDHDFTQFVTVLTSFYGMQRGADRMISGRRGILGPSTA